MRVEYVYVDNTYFQSLHLVQTTKLNLLYLFMKLLEPMTFRCLSLYQSLLPKSIETKTNSLLHLLSLSTRLAFLIEMGLRPQPNLKHEKPNKLLKHKDDTLTH